jgi:hypothetical protein
MWVELKNTGKKYWENTKKKQGGGFQIQNTSIRLNSKPIWLCENNIKPFFFFIYSRSVGILQ